MTKPENKTGGANAKKNSAIDQLLKPGAANNQNPVGAPTPSDSANSNQIAIAGKPDPNQPLTGELIPGAGGGLDQEAETARLAAEETARQAQLQTDTDAAAALALATKENESQNEIPALFISSVGASFRRCGYGFSKDPIGIALECLSEEQIETLKNERNLKVQECMALLDELQVKEVV